jgi:hypothetical protein
MTAMLMSMQAQMTPSGSVSPSQGEEHGLSVRGFSAKP